jgi:hypothetical protein
MAVKMKQGRYHTGVYHGIDKDYGIKHYVDYKETGLWL